METSRKLDIETLQKACEEFRKIEGVASFYDIAMQIVDDHALQSSIILLATWNTARFRFMTSDSQNLLDLENALVQCKPLFEQLRPYDFKNAKFDEIERPVKQIYGILSKVRGIEYTGASKVMHLLNKNLFVMWDAYIRNEYGFENYDDDYFNFLKLMQERFGEIDWKSQTKSFAKAVDEYNTVNITIRKRREREEKAKKKKGR